MYRLLCLLGLLLASGAEGQFSGTLGRAPRTTPRRVPRIQPGHPGNVFGKGELVSVPTPLEYRAEAKSWRAVDIDGQEVRSDAIGEACSLGRLPVGWYRIDLLDGEGATACFTTCAVIEAPSLPTPDDSPVCVDTAVSWFARGDKTKREGFAYLAGIARTNWVRDRLSWGELEPAAGQFAPVGNIYDAASDALAKEQLNVLQVFHSTPTWAAGSGGGSATKRFPADLRYIYSFTRLAARRYTGKVLAWEPWNEANIASFGGHTIDEMCTLQKAAFLGIKAGSPHAVVCWNVFAGAGSRLETEGVLQNETWPYFETYNIHSYSPTESYEGAFAGARDAASGRPIWISECGVRMPATTPKPWGEMSREDERQQAEFLARSFASSLYSGVDRHFFFILGNYWERGVQFGLLRHDLTPRPGYVALAAAGRFLSSARCLGKIAGDGYEMVAFAARPDGQRRTVLVGWSDSARALPLDGVRPDAVFDCYGRPVSAALGPEPRFVLLAEGAESRLHLTPPPARAEWRDGKPSPVVIQAQFRESTRWLHGQAHRFAVGTTRTVPLRLYNFSSSPARGTLSVRSAPKRWRIELPRDDLVIPPGEHLETSLRMALPLESDAVLEGGWVRVAGSFGHLGNPVLAFRLAGEPTSLKPAESKSLASADVPKNWLTSINHGGEMRVEPALDRGTAFIMEFGDSDPWAYPYLPLAAEEAPGKDYDGVSMTVQLLEGSGQVRCQLAEDNGAIYLGELAIDDTKRTPQQVVALFRYASWGSYSKEDTNGKLDPERVRRLLVGINAKANSRVRMVVRDVRWVRF